jgi:hypothetical protein
MLPSKHTRRDNSRIIPLCTRRAVSYSPRFARA